MRPQYLKSVKRTTEEGWKVEMNRPVRFSRPLHGLLVCNAADPTDESVAIFIRPLRGLITDPCCLFVKVKV